MQSALERLREVRGAVLASVRLNEPPPADEIGAACPRCGSTERWRWVDGTLICRKGVLEGDHIGRLSEAGKGSI
jgi:Zinc-binding domain of primase-helicase